MKKYLFNKLLFNSFPANVFVKAFSKCRKKGTKFTDFFQHRTYSSMNMLWWSKSKEKTDLVVSDTKNVLFKLDSFCFYKHLNVGWFHQKIHFWDKKLRKLCFCERDFFTPNINTFLFLWGFFYHFILCVWHHCHQCG